MSDTSNFDNAECHNPNQPPPSEKLKAIAAEMEKWAEDILYRWVVVRSHVLQFAARLKTIAEPQPCQRCATCGGTLGRSAVCGECHGLAEPQPETVPDRVRVYIHDKDGNPLGPRDVTVKVRADHSAGGDFGTAWHLNVPVHGAPAAKECRTCRASPNVTPGVPKICGPCHRQVVEALAETEAELARATPGKVWALQTQGGAGHWTTSALGTEQWAHDRYHESPSTRRVMECPVYGSPAQDSAELLRQGGNLAARVSEAVDATQPAGADMRKRVRDSAPQTTKGTCECCGDTRQLIRGLCHSCTRAYFEDVEDLVKQANERVKELEGKLVQAEFNAEMRRRSASRLQDERSAARRGWDSADGRADRREAERDSACDERDAATASLAAAVRISDQAAREAGSARADLAAIITTYETEPGRMGRLVAAIKKNQPIRSVRVGAADYRAAWADAVKEAGYEPGGTYQAGPTAAAIARARDAFGGKHDDLSYQAGHEFDKAMLDAVGHLEKRMDATEGDTFDLREAVKKLGESDGA